MLPLPDAAAHFPLPTLTGSAALAPSPPLTPQLCPPPSLQLHITPPPLCRRSVRRAAGMEGVGVPTGELVLVFFAVVLSLLLTVWVTVGVDEDAEPSRIMGVMITPAMFYEFGVWFLAGSCLVCGFLPLGLMFSGRVSLDATATALTGLLPAVIVLLGDDVRLLKARAYMRKTPTLRTDAALRFLRLGAVDVRRVVFSDPDIETPPEEAEYTLCRDAKDDEQYTTVHHLYSQPPEGDSQRRCFVVCHVPGRKEKVQQIDSGLSSRCFNDGSNRFWQDATGTELVWPREGWRSNVTDTPSRAETPPRDETPGQDETPPQVVTPPLDAYQTHFWWGKVHVPRPYPVNVVHLTKFDRNHPPLRWWLSLTNAAHVVATPSRVYLEGQDTAVAALALAVDLVVAGDLVLHYFEDYLRSLVRSPHFLKSLDTTAATCNQFFEKVGLANQWGPISASSSSFATPDGFSKCTRGQKYGMVFFLLTEASGNFAVEAGTALGLGTHLVDLLSLKDSATRMPTEVAPSGAPVPPPRPDAVEQKVLDAIHKWLGAWKARDLPPRETIAGEAGPRVEPLDRVTVVRDS